MAGAAGANERAFAATATSFFDVRQRCEIIEHHGGAVEKRSIQGAHRRRLELPAPSWSSGTTGAGGLVRRPPAVDIGRRRAREAGFGRCDRRFAQGSQTVEREEAEHWQREGFAWCWAAIAADTDRCWLPARRAGLARERHLK